MRQEASLIQQFIPFVLSPLWRLLIYLNISLNFVRNCDLRFNCKQRMSTYKRNRVSKPLQGSQAWYVLECKVVKLNMAHGCKAVKLDMCVGAKQWSTANAPEVCHVCRHWHRCVLWSLHEMKLTQPRDPSSSMAEGRLLAGERQKVLPEPVVAKASIPSKLSSRSCPLIKNRQEVHQANKQKNNGGVK